MARTKTKTVYSFSLQKDVFKSLRDLERGPFKGISRSSIVETAILYLHGKHFPQNGGKDAAEDQN
jgi:hypothetical protein